MTRYKKKRTGAYCFKRGAGELLVWFVAVMVVAQQIPADDNLLPEDTPFPATLARSGRLSADIRSDSAGNSERRVQLTLDNTLFLARDRVTSSGKRSYTAGVESPAITVGPVSSKGFQRSLEAPHSLSPLSDTLLEAGGYRLLRSGGYTQLPTIAVRLPGFAFFHRPMEEANVTGVAVDAGARSGNTSTAVLRAFAVYASPIRDEPPVEWTLEKRAPVSGPLWFFGTEAISRLGRAHLAVATGPYVEPAVSATAITDLRGDAGELRAGVTAATRDFPAVDGQRSAYRVRSGVRVSRRTGRVIRPLLQGEYGSFALAPMPDSFRAREYEGAANVELGPRVVYTRPQWRARVKESSQGQRHMRHAGTLGVFVRAELISGSISAERVVSTEEPGYIRGDATLRLRFEDAGRDSLRTSTYRDDTFRYGFHSRVVIERSDARDNRDFWAWDASRDPALSVQLGANARHGALEASFRIRLGEDGVRPADAAGVLVAPASYSSAEISIRYSQDL